MDNVIHSSNQEHFDYQKLVNLKTADEYDNYYSPSRWSTKHPNEEAVIEHFLNVANARNTQVVNLSSNQLNIPYGKSERQKIDIFYGSNNNDNDLSKPIIVYIHGGYWMEGSKELYPFVGNAFTEQGYMFINIGYDLVPDVTIQEINIQVINALHFISNRYPKSKLVVVGHSAGAHLALSAFSDKRTHNYVSRVILISGIYDVSPLLNSKYKDDLRLSTNDCKELNLLSRHCIPTSVKMLILVGSDESPAFIYQSQQLYEELKDKKMKVEFKNIQNEDHFSIIENIYELKSTTTQEIIKFIAQ